MSVPMPTTARSNCSAPIWRSASVSVVSAATTWVKSLAYRWTMSASLVDRQDLVAEPDQRPRDGRAEPAQADDEDRASVGMSRLSQ